MAENPLDTFLFGITRGFAEARGKQKLADIKAGRPVRESPLDGIFGAINRTYTDPRTPDQALRALEINLANEQRKLSQQTAANKLLFDIQKVQAEQKDSSLVSTYFDRISNFGAVKDFDSIIKEPFPEGASPMALGRMNAARNELLTQLNFKGLNEAAAEADQYRKVAVSVLGKTADEVAKMPLMQLKAEVDGALKPRTLTTLEKDFEALANARASGNLALQERIEDKITKQGGSIVQKDDGTIIFDPNSGNGSRLINGQPTLSFRRELQDSIRQKEQLTSLIDRVIESVTDSDVGVAGKLGEVLVDRGLAQIFPEVVDLDRVEIRTLIGLLKERLLAGLKSDSRISDQDARRMEAFLPSSDALESAAKIRQQLTTLKGELEAFREVDEDLLGVEQETPSEPGSVFTGPSGIRYQVIF